MRFRTGLVLGAGMGYLGAVAGRARLDRLKDALGRLGKKNGRQAGQNSGAKARAVIDLTLERARDAVDARRDRPGSATMSTPTFSPDHPGLNGTRIPA